MLHGSPLAAEEGSMAASCDVLVVGGGPAGIGAAVGAGESGARTVLVERHDVLGGMGTAALVNNFCNAHKLRLRDGASRMIIGGVFARLRQRLIERRAIVMTGDRFWMEPYDPAAFAQEAAAMCAESGATALLARSITAIGAVAGGTRVALDDGAVITAATVVDATGDAAMASRLGVPCTFGRPGDHAVMPLTLCYVFGPVDLGALRAARPEAVAIDAATGLEYVFLTELREEVAEAKRRGTLTIPRTHVVSIASIPGRPERVTVNFGRVFCTDPTDPAQLEAAHAEGLRQVEEGLAFYREHLPGFAQVRLIELARQIGVRESRQIVGRYTLTADDILAGRQFPDAVAQCCYAIDIHHPDDIGTTCRAVGGDGHYDIPWRCLVPASGPGNVLVAGRCISATHEAMSSLRVSPTMLALGEAAGIGAAIAARSGGPVAAVDPADVRARLLAQGGVLS
jgi:glycine/D-amino acid oxidase-like deaminating enzyme